MVMAVGVSMVVEGNAINTSLLVPIYYNKEVVKVVITCVIL